jgi:hypothetical protein
MTARWARRHKTKPTLVGPLLWVAPVTYRPAQPPENDAAGEIWPAIEPQAPLSWPIQACLITTDAACQAYTDRSQKRSLVWTLAVGLIYSAGALRAKTALERRRARQLGLTIEIAPRPNLDCLSSLPPLVVWRAYLKLRGLKQTEPWPHTLARSIIGEINRRRSWRRALTRTAQPARSPQS